MSTRYSLQRAGVAWPVRTYRALVLLVVACPRALVVSTRVLIVSGLAANLAAQPEGAQAEADLP